MNLHRARHKRATTVAFIAACVLVLQAFLGAWATGAMAATPTHDAFGNPLCITSVDGHGTTPASDHSKLPDCCTFGCNMASSLLDTARDDDGIGLLRPLSSHDVRFALAQSFPIQRPDHDPGNPRAPPVTA